MLNAVCDIIDSFSRVDDLRRVKVFLSAEAICSMVYLEGDTVKFFLCVR
jgi:hypothetical protein